MQILNIGCANTRMEGAINADISSLCNPDVVCSVVSLPFEDNEFDEVFAYNILTQIESNKDFVKAINELHRVTKGIIHIRVPNAMNICAFQDPMDSRRFTDQTFTYMQIGHKRYDQYGRHYGFLPFEVLKIEDNGRQMLFDLYPIK